jgi:hypothetical protein
MGDLGGLDLGPRSFTPALGDGSVRFKNSLDRVTNVSLLVETNDGNDEERKNNSKYKVLLAEIENTAGGLDGYAVSEH